jgi:hypothetical protein
VSTPEVDLSALFNDPTLAGAVPLEPSPPDDQQQLRVMDQLELNAAIMALTSVLCIEVEGFEEKFMYLLDQFYEELKKVTDVTVS